MQPIQFQSHRLRINDHNTSYYINLSDNINDIHWKHLFWDNLFNNNQLKSLNRNTINNNSCIDHDTRYN
jgi:hypothetical protein